MLLSGVLTAVAGAGTFAATGATFLLPVSVLLLLGAWYGCFFLANQEIRAAKAAGNWYGGLHQGIAVDTGLRSDPPRFPWLWLAFPVTVTVATGAIGVVEYPSMPALLAVHYGAGGQADRLAPKSFGTAFSLVIVQVIVTLLLSVIAAGILRGRADLDPAHPQASARWHRQYASLGARALLGLAGMIALGMMGSSLLMWTGTRAHWAAVVVVVPVLAGVGLAMVVLARYNREPQGTARETGLTHRDDDKFWRGGLLYINREDHALMVPRRFGLGWTLNFGNPRAGMLLAGVLALISLAVILRFGG
ncbi:DUF5808 domain-containing protein [Pseudarthrobacter sp. fls2-241-R2A-127]|uniref:DUF1648 domain-containing protein n=1 Tax=Pseudarthrobacter sp. fls2-241-R2A-127 TaxID=3040303 RepID=UPI0025565435|nr:DUF5808 domain-containing protein [Pseudarthrobacter sp. fls2-241-R2A-127]